MTKRKKAPAATPPPGTPRTGACYFCGMPTNIIRSLWHKGGDASRCTVKAVWPWSEETQCFVCLQCDAGGGPIILVPKVTWAREAPQGVAPCP